MYMAWYSQIPGVVPILIPSRKTVYYWIFSKSLNGEHFMPKNRNMNTSTGSWFHSDAWLLLFMWCLLVKQSSWSCLLRLPILHPSFFSSFGYHRGNFTTKGLKHSLLWRAFKFSIHKAAHTLLHQINITSYIHLIKILPKHTFFYINANLPTDQTCHLPNRTTTQHICIYRENRPHAFILLIGEFGS